MINSILYKKTPQNGSASCPWLLLYKFFFISRVVLSNPTLLVCFVDRDRPTQHDDPLSATPCDASCSHQHHTCLLAKLVVIQNNQIKHVPSNASQLDDQAVLPKPTILAMDITNKAENERFILQGKLEILSAQNVHLAIGNKETR
jgi:hypothetical protein